MRGEKGKGVLQYEVSASTSLQGMCDCWPRPKRCILASSHAGGGACCSPNAVNISM